MIYSDLKLKRNLKHFKPIALILVCSLPALVLMLSSAIPWTFTYLWIGRLIGPNESLMYVTRVLFVLTIFAVSLKVSMKLKRIGTIWMITRTIIISLIIPSLVIFSFSMVFMPQVLQVDQKIDMFVAKNANSSFDDYITNVASFLNNNVNSTWNKPEASFEIDNWVSISLLDPYIMRFWGVTRADLIVYQRWGGCGQAAILIEDLLQRAGYETRQAVFKGIDHQWAEVNYNGTWWIVDPWYIGNFVDIQNLRSSKPAFQEALGVEVQYNNGTRIDASSEHGY